MSQLALGIQAVVVVFILVTSDGYFRYKRDWDDGIRSYNRNDPNLSPRLFIWDHFFDILSYVLATLLIIFNVFILEMPKTTMSYSYISTSDLRINSMTNIILISCFFIVDFIPAVYAVTLYTHPFSGGFWKCFENKFGIKCLISFTILLIITIIIHFVIIFGDDNSNNNDNDSDLYQWWLVENGYLLILVVLYIIYFFVFTVPIAHHSWPFAVSDTTLGLGSWAFWKVCRKITFAMFYDCMVLCVMIIWFVTGCVIIDSKSSSSYDEYRIFWTIIFPLTIEIWCLFGWISVASNRCQAQNVVCLYRCWNKFWYKKAISYRLKKDPLFKAVKWTELQIIDKKEQARKEERDRQRQIEKRKNSHIKRKSSQMKQAIANDLKQIQQTKQVQMTMDNSPQNNTSG